MLETYLAIFIWLSSKSANQDIGSYIQLLQVTKWDMRVGYAHECSQTMLH